MLFSKDGHFTVHQNQYFTGDISIDGQRLRRLYVTSDVNLATVSSELTAEDTIDAGSALQSLTVYGK